MRNFPGSEAPSTKDGGGGAWRVLVADDDCERRVALAAALTHGFPQARVRACAVTELERGVGGAPHVALVALAADGAAAERALAGIGWCRSQGAAIFGCGCAMQTWSMAQKCRPLIAGATRVFDVTAADFPASVHQAVRAVFESLGARQREERHLRERLQQCGVIGESAPMLELFRKVMRIGPLSDLPVLLTGETGTGKERFAQALHQCDPKRSRAPLVAINCAALAPNLAESELFGHRRGAFTGAERARPGLVRAADGGVLFLDEIGELDLTLQSKLLRVLQEGRVLGVGEENEVAVDVRVIAATNRDLRAMVAAGRFRADLFHRLSVLGLELPPLRGRSADIASLARYFIGKYRTLSRASRHEPAADFIDALCRHPLPGNVRQLENLVRQALVHKADDAPLALADLPLEALWELAGAEPMPPVATAVAEAAAAFAAGAIQASAAGQVAPAASPTVVAAAPMPAADASELLRIAEENNWNLTRCVRACEREVLAAALKRVDGNQTKAANLLGVTSRSIYNKLRKLGLDP